MAERTIKTKLLVRTDTTANWESENPILQANEFGFDSTVQAFKKGDGTTTWKNLEYVTDIRLANKTEIANANERVYLVIGNTTGTAGTWTGTNERITSYFDGLLINYKIGVAGGSSTTTLNINGLGAKTIYLRGTTKLTTHYEVGTMVLLSYNSSKGAFYSADYDANSYAYVRQYTTTTSAEYPMLMAYETTIPSSYDTKYVRKNSTIKANPSTGTITATTFKGSLNGNADTSTKATQDGNGNVISETYATKEELENAILNGGGSEQQWTPKTGDLVLTEPEYIYISSPLTPFAYYTIAEGRAVAEGMSIKVYKDPSLPTYTFAIFNGSDFEFEAPCEQTQYNNVYCISSMGGYALMPITMTPNDDVYFINETLETYYTKEEIDEKLTIIEDKFNNLDITDISDLPYELEAKVDKVSGKGLSTNDYTTAEKNKLAGISYGADVNVQSDWNDTNTSSDAFIKNKPKIPTKVTDLLDASNYATKQDLENLGSGSDSSILENDNTFTGDNWFEGEISFNNLIYVNSIGDSNGNFGQNGQVLTANNNGETEWRTPSGGSSSGTSYPEIGLEDSIYTDHSGTLSQDQYDAIIEAGGFISSIEKEGEGLNTPFLIDFSYETDLRLVLNIQQPQDYCIYYVCMYINKESLEYYTEYYYGYWLDEYASEIFWNMVQYVDITNGIQDWHIQYIQNNPTLKVKYNDNIYTPTQYNYDIENMTYSCIKNNNTTTFCKSLAIGWGHKSITQYECNLTGGVYDLLSLNIDLSSNSSGTLTLTIVSQLQGKEKIKIGTSNLYAILNFSSEYDIGETRNIITYSGCVGTDGGVKQIYFVIYPDNTYQVTVKSV